MKKYTLGIILGVLLSFTSFYLTAYKDLVSIEYTEPCKCGSTLECYKSFHDDYGRKECKECGYYITRNGDK